MPISLEALRIVAAIARRGSFAAAAAELGKVPSALTYSVRKLEDELDVLLFDRRGNRSTLTDAGRELLSNGQVLLRAAEDLAHRVRGVAAGWEPALRIGLNATIGFERLVPLIEDFYRLGQTTQLRISAEVLAGSWDALDSGRIDLAIGAPGDGCDEPGVAGRLRVEPLGETAFVFCAAPHHPLAAHTGPIDVETLRAQRAIVVADTSRDAPALTRGLLEGQDRLTVPTLDDKFAAQVAGLGVGWLPATMVAQALRDGRLRELTLSDPRPPYALVYAWRRSARGKAIGWWLDRLAIPTVRTRLIGVAQPQP